MTQFTCPTCDKAFDSVESRSLPFCSPRCKQIDLGRWLAEENRVPLRPGFDDEQDDSPSRLYSDEQDD
jgi:endogenous inhibitor of DNA gyrase (YacG/DUF329 family)